MEATNHPTPFIRLDFTGEETLSSPVFFADPDEVLTAWSEDEVRPLLAKVEAVAKEGRYAVGFLTYEAATAFEPAMEVHSAGELPLAWFAVFETFSTRPPHGLPAGQDFEHGEWKPDLSRAQYDDVVEEIRRAIGAGETYQVNFTLRLRSSASGDPRRYYERLVQAQEPGYGACIDLGRFQILSASPELFFRRESRSITTRPMKGTALRGRWPAEDDSRALALRSSEKEQAENAMIVDLIRNDLGRICEYGSVQAPHVFQVERYPTVLQMTSTVTGTLREGTSLSNIFEALFPCGSVTGAPKIETTKKIALLESGPRQVYCGALGIVYPGGDCTFNVPIRTVVVDRERGIAEYGVGGGITWDSAPSAEYAEAVAKARILEWRQPSFRLLETLRVEEGVAVRLNAHLDRMAESADYFGFPFSEAAAQSQVSQVIDGIPDGTHRLRLLLSEGGQIEVECEAYVQSVDARPQPVAFATEAVNSRDPFLFHKTTHRKVYETRHAERPDLFDVLLENEHGEVTEFTIGNIVAELDGKKFTPPRECGLLNGVFRQELIERGEVEVKTLSRENIQRASRLWLVNSVREWVQVEVLLKPEKSSS